MILSQLPFINPGEFMATGVIEKIQPVPLHYKGTKAFPARGFMKDPKDSPVQIQPPPPPFRSIIRAAPAGDGRFLFRVEFDIGPIDQGGDGGRQRFKGVRIPILQGRPSLR
jgi:hypothetical protein